MATFGNLLRDHRVSAGLTQERLAERAGLSPTGVAALESGRRRAPRLTTVTLLADALALDVGQRRAFAAVATEPPRAAPTSAGPAPQAARPAVPRRGNFPQPTGRTSFVGRDRELTRLINAWDRRVRYVQLTGEAGVGKTRLSSELAEHAGTGAVVLWGRCTQHRVGGYEPFVAPLRAAVAESTTNGSFPTDLAPLLPELALTRARAGDERFAGWEVDQRLLFDAIAGVLAGLGRTLLVLDDLQWADAGSLALLTHLVGEQRLTDLTVLGTVRSTDQDDEHAAALAGLARLATVERIELTGLGTDAVSAIVGELAGDARTDPLVAAVAGAAGGNPLFVEELTEHLVEHQSSPDGTRGRAMVPLALQDTIRQRVTTLSPDAQSLVRAGAVLGRSFDPQLAGQLAGLTDDAILASAEDALLSGLVVEISPREVSFSHGVVHAAVEGTLSGLRRVDLHRRAARELEATASDAGIAPPTYEIAHHWDRVAAADPTAAPQAGAWTRRAGDDAAAVADTDEAIEHYRRAVHWTFASNDPSAHGEAELRLGSALSARCREDEAATHLRVAVDVGERERDPRLFARAAIALASPVRYGHSDPELITLLERSVEWLDPDDAVLRTMAAAMLKRQLGFDPSEEASARRRAAAAVVLDAVSQPELSEDLLLTLGTARDAIMADDPVVLDRLSRETIRAGRAARRLQVQANGWYGRAWAALELADAASWRESTDGFTTVAEQLDLPYELALAQTMAATTALVEGRYDESVAHADRALELGRDADPNATSIHLINAVMVGVDRGHAPEMVELMTASRNELAEVPTFLAGYAATAAVGGAPEVARELLGELAVDRFRTIRRDLEWLPVIGFLAHTAALLDSVEHAGTLHDLLSAHPARAVRVGPLAGWWGPVDFHLGGLRRVQGRVDEAIVLLRRAVATCEELRARPWLARCQLELARLLDLAGRGDPIGDGEPAALRAAAHETAEQLGAPGIAAAPSHD